MQTEATVDITGSTMMATDDEVVDGTHRYETDGHDAYANLYHCPDASVNVDPYCALDQHTTIERSWCID